jgi:hypothetical protein
MICSENKILASRINHLSKSKVVSYSLKTSLPSNMNSSMKLSVDRRRPRGCHGDYWVSREAYKRMAIRPHPLITVPHPLLSSLSIVDPGNGAQATWRCRSWEVYDCHYDTYCTLCCISPLRPSPDPVLAHHARPCFYTQVSHITAEGCLCLSRGEGEGAWRV